MSKKCSKKVVRLFFLVGVVFLITDELPYCWLSLVEQAF